MAYDFFANKGAIDILHDGKAVPAEKARIAESFLVQKTDTRFHGWVDYSNQPVNLEGAWATVIKIEDEALRKLYRTGAWKGVSMGGTAVVEQEKSDLAELTKALLEQLNKAKTQEGTMDSAALEKITKTLTDGLATLSTGISEAIAKALKPPQQDPKPEPKPDPKPEPQAPVYKAP